MSLKLVYPHEVVGQGFIYRSEQTGGAFQNINIYKLHEIVSLHLQANNFTLNNEEFEANVCKNTPNVVCTEGIRGAGDLFHALVGPVASAVDYVIGSNLSGCGGCFKRQQQMNQ